MPARLWFSPNCVVQRQRLRHHRARKPRPQVVQQRIGQRHQRAQAVVAARELDHHEHVVVGDPLLLGGVDGTRERVGDRRVARGEAGRAGAEHKSRAKEVAALQLVDADFIAHLFTYLSWNSGEARVMNQRVRSSVAWLRRAAVCVPSTPSR